MDINVFLSSFGLIFIAELGDKTQLTSMALALRFPWRRIFIGIALAFAVLNFLAVVVGKMLFLFLPEFWIRIVSAVLFLYFGISTLRSHPEDEEVDSIHASDAFRTAFIMIFMAELGDKTQLVTASLAAQNSGSLPGTVSVFVSSTLALWSVSLIGIFAGRQLVRFVPMIYIHRAAGFMFLLFGAATIFRLMV